MSDWTPEPAPPATGWTSEGLPVGYYGDILSITGPRGVDGAPGVAATVAVGSVVTGAPGSAVSVTNAGSSSAAVLNFTIPRGDVGPLNQTYTVGASRPVSPSIGDIHVNPYANPTSTVLLGVQSYWRRFLTGVSL